MKTLLIIILSLLSYSCSSNNVDGKHRKLINNLITEGAESPFSYYSNTLLFCKSSDVVKLGCIEVEELKKIYNNQYKQVDYQEFLTKLLDEELVLDCSILNKCFILNDTIRSSYKQESFPSFLAKYTEKAREGEYTVIANLSDNAELTVFYYLSLNEYYTSFDDYIGLFYSRKVTDLVIETVEPVFE